MRLILQGVGLKSTARMMSLKIVAALFLAVACPVVTVRAQDMSADCRIGIYHLRDGSDVDIAPGEDSHLRWRRKDGTSGELTRATDNSWTSTLGWTSRPDGKRVSFSECAKGEITFAGISG